MANQQIRFGVGFDIDNNSLNSLKSSLDSLSKMSLSDVMKINNSDLEAARVSLDEIRKEAENVRTAINASFNQKLNTVNMDAFNQSLKSSETSLEQIHRAFSQAGANGTAAFRSLANQVTSTNVQLKQTHSIIDNMATTLANTIKWNVASGAVNSFSRSVQGAYGYIKALDGSLNDIQIVTQKSADQMANFAKEANNAAKELGITTTDYTDAALIFYQQGLNDEEVKARTDLTTKVANASGLDAEDAAEYVTAVLNGYKVGSEQAEAAMDKLAAVGANTASSLAELSEGMSKVAASAHTMGVSEDQLAASLSTVIAATRQNASQVGTAFKTIYARISDIKAGTADAEISLGRYTSKMAEMGFNVLDSSGNLRDLGEVVEEIGNSWGNLTREQQVSLAQTMAGTRQYNNLLALFDNWDEYLRAVNISMESNGTLQRQQDVYLESTEAHLNRLSAAWEDVYDSTLDAKTINTISDFLSTIADKIAFVIDSIGGGTGVLSTLGMVAVTVFSKQIAGGINTFLTNMDIAKQNAEGLANALEKIGEIKGISGLDETTNKLMATKEQMYQLAQYLPTDKIEELTGKFNILTEQANNVTILTEEFNALKKVLDSIANGEGKYNEGLLNSEEYSALEKELETTQSFYENLHKEVIALASDIGMVGVGQAGQGFKTVGETAESASQRIEQMKAAMEHLNKTGNLSVGEWERLSEKIKLYEEALKQAQSQGQDFNNNEGLQNAGKSLAMTFDAILQQKSKSVSEVLNHIVEESQGKTDSIKQLLDAAELEAKRTGQEIGDILNNAARHEAIEGMINMGQAITSIAFSVQRLKSLGSIWSEEDVSVGEKLLKTVVLLGTTLPVLATALGKANSAFKMFIAAETAAGAASESRAAAMETETVAAGKATIATKTFNEVLRENPVTAVVMAITALIAVLMAAAAAYDAFTMNAKEAEKALKDFDEKVKNLSASAKAYDSNKQTLEDMREEYDALSAKAGEYDKNIASLTDSERKRYNEIKNTIADLNSESIAYYNSEGEAILKNNHALEDTIELLKEKFELENRSLYTGKDFKDTTKAEDVTYNSKKREVEAAKEQAEGPTGLSFQSTNASANAKKIKDVLTSAMEENADLQKQVNDFVKTVEKGLDDLDLTTLEKYRQAFTKKELGLNKDTLKFINEELDAIKERKNKYSDLKAEQAAADNALAEAMKPNLSLILGAIKYNDKYNQGWSELGKKGQEVAQGIIADYVQGLRLGADGKMADLYKATDEFAQQLAKAMAVDPKFASELESTQKQFNDTTFNNYSLQRTWLEKNIGDFIKNHQQAWDVLEDESKKQLLKSLFGDIEDIEIGNDGNISKITDKYEERFNKLRDKIKELNPEATEEEISKAITRGSLDNLDKVIAKLEEVDLKGKDIIEVMRSINKESSFESSVKNPENLSDLRSGRKEARESSLSDERKAELEDAYSDSLQNLASQYENTQEALENYQKALKSEDETAIAIAEDTLEQATAIGELAEQYGFATGDLEKYAEAMRESNAEADGATIAEMAKEQARFDRAITSSQKNLKKWKKNLANIGKETTSMKKMTQELADAYGDLLDMDGSQLSKNFLQDSENLELLEKAINGSSAALDELHKKARRNYIVNLGLEPGAEQEALTALDEIENKFLNTKKFLETPIGAELKIDGFLDALTNLVNAAHMSRDQAVEFLKTMGVDAQIVSDDQVDEDINEWDGVEGEVQTEKVNFVSPLNPLISVSSEIPTGVSYKFTPEKSAVKKSTTAHALKVIAANKTSSGGNITKSRVRSPSPKPSGGSPKGGRKKGKKGGGKKGSSKTQEAKTKDLNEDTINRYHDIDIQIGKLTKSYDRLEKVQEKLVGRDLIKNLNEQLKILQKQKEAYADKIELAKMELAETKNTLASYGATFNATTGQISNYVSFLTKAQKELNKTISWYNGLSGAKQDDAAEKKVENAQKKYDKILELVEKYDELINDTIPDLEDEITDALYKEIETQITKFDTSIEIRLDMSSAERDWNEFLRKVVYNISDDSLLGAANQSRADILSYYNTNNSGYGSVQAETDRINSILDELRIMDSGGHSGIYSAYDARMGMWVDDRASAMEALEESYTELMSELQDLEDLQNDIKETFLDSIDAVNDAFDAQKENYEFLNEQIEHDINMMELLYGDEAYSRMATYYDKQIANTKEELATQQMIANYWKQKMDLEQGALNAGNGNKEALERYEENWKNAISDLNELLENWISQVTTKYENTIDEMIDRLNRKITNNLGLEYLNEQITLLDTNAENYLDRINAAYSIQKLQNKWQEALDSTDSIAGQQMLNSLMREQMEMLERKGQLTQYDIDRAEKEYEIALKQLALQEAQKNKSQMRLKRDANGNYSYQFVSDEDNVRQAQQELAELQNDLYNFDKSAYQDNLDEMYSTWDEFQGKIADAYKTYANDQDALQEHIALLQEQYGERINFLTEQNLNVRTNLTASAFADLADIYNTDVENFEAMTSREKDLIMNDLIPQWSSGVQAMIDTFSGEGGFEEVCRETFDILSESAEDYIEELAAVTTANEEASREAYKESEELLSESELLIQSAQDEYDAIGRVVDQVNELVDVYRMAKVEAIAATQAAYSYWQQENSKATPAFESGPAAMGSGKGSDTSSDGGGGAGGAVGSASSSSSAGGSKSGTTATTDLIKGIAAAIWCESDDGWGDDPERRKKLISKFNEETRNKIQSYINNHSDNGDIYRYWVNTLHRNASAFHYNKFKRGGLANYTGPAWVDGSPSNPELVLNSTDTKNMLSALDIIRKVTATLGSNVLQKIADRLGDLNTLGSAGFGITDTIQQIVHIDASFEGQTEAVQIENALNNLINIAAQRAYRNNK